MNTILTPREILRTQHPPRSGYNPLPNEGELADRRMASFLNDAQNNKPIAPQSLMDEPINNTRGKAFAKSFASDSPDFAGLMTGSGSKLGSYANFGLGALGVVGDLGLGIWQNINQGRAIDNQDRQFEENLSFRKDQTDRMWEAAKSYGLASPFQATAVGRVNASGSNDGFVNMGNYATQLLNN